MMLWIDDSVLDSRMSDTILWVNTRSFGVASWLKQTKLKTRYGFIIKYNEYVTQEPACSNHAEKPDIEPQRT